MDKKLPNIIFLLVDGLRADQCFGKDKTSVTPNIDSLIQKGMYFTNAYSSVDGTIVSLNTIFNGDFQIGNSSRAQKVNLKQNNLIEVLKRKGYHVYGTLPNFASFDSLLEQFENKIEENTNKNDVTIDPVEAQFKEEEIEGSHSEYERNKATLPTGLTEKIIKILNSDSIKEPFFGYFHIFDLHPLREGKNPIGIEGFDKEEYGVSTFSKTVSSIDFWLGKILENVNLDNTILILTADHGERIPYENTREVDFQPKLENTVTIGKKLLPKSAHKIGGKFLHNIRKSVGKSKLEKSNKTLTNYEKRSRDPYFTLSLYDELIHVPLLFVGSSINPQIIEKQARHVDICSTIYDLLGITVINEKSGESLRSNEYDIEKNIQYLHTMPYQKLSTSDMVGIRNNEYKYFRFARNLNENVHLYDLKQDPYENNNIADENKELILEFERKITEFEKNDLSNDDDDLSEEELTKISGQLKKLGYM